MKKLIFSVLMAVGLQAAFAQMPSDTAKKGSMHGIDEKKPIGAQNTNQNPISNLKQNGNEIDYANMKQGQIDMGTVPAPVSSAFSQKYADQKDVTWYQTDGGYSAVFTGSDKMEQRLMYDQYGTYRGMGRQLNTSELPASSSAYMKKTYPNEKYDRVFEVTPATGDKYYVVYRNGQWMRFDMRGEYVPPAK